MLDKEESIFIKTFLEDELYKIMLDRNKIDNVNQAKQFDDIMKDRIKTIKKIIKKIIKTRVFNASSFIL